MATDLSFKLYVTRINKLPKEWFTRFRGQCLCVTVFFKMYIKLFYVDILSALLYKLLSSQLCAQEDINKELSGRVLDSRPRVRASQASLCCVLEQNTLILV